MRRLAIAVLLVGIAVSQGATDEPINVFLASRCADNSTGAILESSFRESVRSSTGYRLADRQGPGVFMFSIACVEAGEQGEGWTAVAYTYGLEMKATPEKLGLSIWNPTLGVFTVGRTHAESKGRELFARFDNSLHEH